MLAIVSVVDDPALGAGQSLRAAIVGVVFV